MARPISIAVAILVLATSVACDEPTRASSAVSDLTVQQHVDQILASDEVIFAHDHLRDVQHLQDALAGHVTAMTVELTVDQMKWVDIADAPRDAGVPYPYAPLCQRNQSGGLVQHEVTTCCSGIQGNDCFVNDIAERSWFDAARSDLNLAIAQLTGQASIVSTVADIDAAKAAGHLGIIIGTEGALVTCSSAADCPTDAACPLQNSPACLPAGTGALANMDALYQLGWRKAQLHHLVANPFIDEASPGGPGLTRLGQQFVAIANRRGIVIDTDHLGQKTIGTLLQVDNAPLLISHEWQRGYQLTHSDTVLRRHAWSGGGHGVIGVNDLGAYWSTANQSPPNSVPPGCTYSTVTNTSTPSTIAEFIQRLDCMRLLVGVDHIAIGPDYMPGADWYAIGGGVYDLPPNLSVQGGTPPNGTVRDLVTALVTWMCYVDLGGGIFHWQTCYSDDDIKKMLGGNLRDLYQRVWDPTHGYDGGPAHFQLCPSSSQDPACLAAASNFGQGDLHHRAISCQHDAGQLPVGLQISYSGTAPTGSWSFRDLNNNIRSCYAGSALVVSWGDGAAANGHLGIYGTSSCDAACQAATTGGGTGTTHARALSCGSATAPGVIGLELAYTSAWSYYNVAAQLATCKANSTWIASWSDTATTNPASVRLCDDANTHPACQAAATANGAGTAQAKVLSCLNSTATDPACSGQQCGFDASGTPAAMAAPTGLGSVALEVAYLTDPLTGTGRWYYYDQAGGTHRCVHGSVLVATSGCNFNATCDSGETHATCSSDCP